MADNVNPVPNQLVNGITVDAPSLMANFNSIINDCNDNLAGSGANSDITSLTGLVNLSVSADVTAAGSIAGATGSFGTLNATTSATFTSATVTQLTVGSGGASLAGALTVDGIGTFQSGVSTTAVTASAAIFSGGSISCTGDIDVGGNLHANNLTFTAGATADILYNSFAGSIVCAQSGAVRAQNTVSARLSFSSLGITNPFNVASTTTGSTGVYNFVFSEALFTANYQVIAAPSMSGSNLIFGICTAKSTTGFSISYFTAAGTATNIGTQTSDIIVTGGN